MNSKMIFYMTVTALAVALTACAKGFKVNEIKTPSITQRVEILGGACNVAQVETAPYASPAYDVQLSNSEPLIHFMVAQNSNIASILNDPKFMGPPSLTAKMAMTLTNLTPGNTVSAGIGSEIRFRGMLSAACGAEVRLESTDALLYLDAPATGNPKITGAWNMETATGRATLKIEAQITRNEYVSVTSPYEISGTLLGSFANTTTPEILGTFKLPLCAVMSDDDLAWLPEAAASCAQYHP